MQYWGGGAACHDLMALDVPCTNNGDVVLPFGSAPYVGLGLIVYTLLVILETFGSPFLRNTQVRAVLRNMLGLTFAG